jgi:hypothetical protein
MAVGFGAAKIRASTCASRAGEELWPEPDRGRCAFHNAGASSHTEPLYAARCAARRRHRSMIRQTPWLVAAYSA